MPSWNLYSKDIINKFRKSDTWKNYLTIAFDLVSSKDSYEEHVMHSKSDKITIMIYDKEMKLLKNFLNHFLIDIK